MSFDPRSPSDCADIDALRGDVPNDWNGKLYVNKPLPESGMVWVVTDEGEVHEVAFDDAATLYLGKPHWSRQDGEAGSWMADEILGWTTSHEDAEEAASLLLGVSSQAGVG